MADNVDEIINCPACGKPMKKVYMPEQKVYLDVCTEGCGGIYFDNREYLKFDEHKEDITPLVQILDGKTFQKVDESETRICPVCGMKMVKNYSSSYHKIQIDECYRCGGKFLDYGELNAIRDEFETEAERGAAAIAEFKTLLSTQKFDDAVEVDKAKKSFMTSLIMKTAERIKYRM